MTSGGMRCEQTGMQLVILEDIMEWIGIHHTEKELMKLTTLDGGDKYEKTYIVLWNYYYMPVYCK